MPITVHLTDDGLGFIMKGKGIVTGQEIIDGVAKRFASEERIKKYIYGMSDYTDVEEIQMSTSEVKRVAEKDEYVSSLNPNLVIAIAAPQDIIFGLSRMFENYAANTGWIINVFRTADEAKESITSNLKDKFNNNKSITFKESDIL